MFQLNGKIAAVTGAGSGIGRAIASAFAGQGARVILLDRDLDAAKQAAGDIDEGLVEPVGCDVTDRQQVVDVLGEVATRHGGLDVMVNNAGIAHIGTCTTTEPEDLDRVYQVNVKGVYHGMQAALPHLIERGGGVILNLASIASVVGLRDRFAYSMSKGAVLTMTLSVASDFLEQNVRCNCLCPARVHTPFVDRFIRDNYPGREDEMFAKLSASQPIGRMARPEEVAAQAVYLCSDEASFITGGVFPIDGGVINLR